MSQYTITLEIARAALIELYIAAMTESKARSRERHDKIVADHRMAQDQVREDLARWVDGASRAKKVELTIYELDDYLRERNRAARFIELNLLLSNFYATVGNQ